MKNKIKISQDLIKDLQKYSVDFCIGIAKEVRSDLTKTAFNSINYFYGNYKQHYYRRHYYNFRKKSFWGVYENAHSSIIRGGIELSSLKMDNIYYSYAGDPVDKDYIFNLVYSGYHGNMPMLGNEFGFIVTKPSPLEMIQDRRDYIVSNINLFKKYGFNNIKWESFTTLF